ncbi:MAG TPA: hypothetical protein VN673_00300, partial [Clostridia bacterium]|nr:hypothetical protein [Clostridia bacterium]
TLKVSDDGDPPLADTQTFEVIVDYTNMPPVLAPVPDQIMVAGETVDFVAVADDANIPPQSLTFSLGEGAPAGSSITADGHFTWVTAPTLAGSTNGVVIQVIDDGSPPLISTKAFHVVLHEVALESCTNLCGLFVQHPAVEIYPELREITVPRASGAVFFRLRSMAPVRFEWINRTNDMLRMRYRME